MIYQWGLCPFPLLFGITLEPLAQAIRTHPGFNGFKLGGAERIISLYADDMLLLKPGVIFFQQWCPFLINQKPYLQVANITINIKKGLPQKLKDSYLNSYAMKRGGYSSNRDGIITGNIVHI